MQSRPSVVVACVDGGALCDEALDLLEVPLRRCVAHFLPHRHAVVRVLVRQPQRAVLLEEGDDGHVVASHCVFQRVGAPSVLGADVGLLLEKEFDGGQMTLRGGEMQRGASVVHDGVDAGVGVDELRCRGVITLRRGLAKLLPERLLVLRIDGCAMLNEEISHLAVPVEHCFFQWVSSPSICNIYIRRALDQEFYYCNMPFCCSQVHRAAFVVICGVGVRVRIHQLLQLSDVSFCCCFTQIFSKLLLPARRLVHGGR
mmetsp:Transcript_29367/g.59168  ORF Transcript_29367/g.59168 Transcript_29367/m.59168 type:complete len:257 (-) Transcript_29367:292-1062(-)